MGRKSLADRLASLAAPESNDFTHDDFDDGTAATGNSTFEYEGEVVSEAGAIRKKLGINVSDDPRYIGKKVSRKSILKQQQFGDDSESEVDATNSGSNSSSGEDQELESEEQFGSDSESESNNPTPSAVAEGLNDSNEGSSSDQDSEESEDGGFDEYDKLGITGYGTAGKDGGDLDESEQQKMIDEMNALEEEEEESGMVEMKSVNLQKEREKGMHSKNLMKLWDKLLEVRIRTQNVLTTAHQFPHYDKFDTFVEDESVEEEGLEAARHNVNELLNDLLLIQKNFMGQIPEVKICKPALKRKLPEVNDSCDKYWKYIKKVDEHYQPYRDNVITQWNNKVMLSSGKISLQKQLKAVSQSVLKQVENIMQDEDRLLTRCQTIRGTYTVLGEEVAAVEQQQGVDKSKGSLSGDPGNNKKVDAELYDDNDFYHYLLRELIAGRTSFSQGDDQFEMGQKWLEVQSLKKQKDKKKVDTRASKGRKVRYVVQEKLVNFMFPVTSATASESVTREQLVKNMFT